jgi:hypothetical protein
LAKLDDISPPEKLRPRKTLCAVAPDKLGQRIDVLAGKAPRVPDRLIRRTPPPAFAASLNTLNPQPFAMSSRPRSQTRSADPACPSRSAPWPRVGKAHERVSTSTSRAPPSTGL